MLFVVGVIYIFIQSNKAIYRCIVLRMRPTHAQTNQT
jgi:hypothetical protein